MTIGRSIGGRKLWQSLALWLGLVALTIQGLVPLCVSGAGGNAIVICTSHGYETIQLDADGKAVPGAPAADHAACFLCLGCHVGGAFTAPALVAFVAPSLGVHGAPSFADASAPARAAYQPYASRAPPNLSETMTA